MHEKEKGREARHAAKANPVPARLVDGGEGVSIGASYADRLAAYRACQTGSGSAGEESAPASPVANLILRRISGLYAIVCNPTGHVYIGASSDLPLRYRTHFARLRCGGHDNKRLQGLFNGLGENAFSFVPMVPVSLRRQARFDGRIVLKRLGTLEKEWIVALRNEIGELLLNTSNHAVNFVLDYKMSPERLLWRLWWPPLPCGGPVRVKRMRRKPGPQRNGK